MNLEQELNKKEFDVCYYKGNAAVYYIEINKILYTFGYDNIDYIYSLIVIGLIRTNLEYTKKKYGLVVCNKKDIITSIIYEPKLTYPKKTYLIPRYNYFPKNRDELHHLVRKLIEIRGNKCSLNDIDTSRIRNMYYMFSNSKFNGDISEWDVSNINDMDSMFENSKFNGDINNWNVSNVRRKFCAFSNSPLEDNEPKWY